MEKLKNAETLVPAIEKYIFSEKKDVSALTGLIPGSTEEQYFRAIEALSSETPYSALSEEVKTDIAELLKKEKEGSGGPRMKVRKGFGPPSNF